MATGGVRVSLYRYRCWKVLSRDRKGLCQDNVNRYILVFSVVFLVLSKSLMEKPTVFSILAVSTRRRQSSFFLGIKLIHVYVAHHERSPFLFLFLFISFIFSSFTDEAYEEAGATVVKGSEAWKADIVVKARTELPSRKYRSVVETNKWRVLRVELATVGTAGAVDKESFS